MLHRYLGPQRLEVSAVGLGCMSFSQCYPPYPTEEEAMRVLRGAHELGITFFDTADVYGNGANEQLVGRALRPIREHIVLASKCGFNFYADAKAVPGARGVCCRPEYIRMAIDRSLQRLGTDRIDLYYLHRVDPQVPVEDCAGVMEDLMRQGKIRHWGLSEAGPASIRRAHAVCPLTAVQSEYSLWFRQREHDVIPVCRELGIGFVPFSPVGRGLLTGTISSDAQYLPGDLRRGLPRFNGTNLEQNLKFVEGIARIARDKDATPAQVCLAWLLAQSDSMVPIPGTTRLERVAENALSASITFSAEELRQLDEELFSIEIAGPRYTASQERLTGL